MRERLRAPLAAAVAFLIGGELLASGPWGLLDPWRFLFPYLWLFLAFEAARRRRRLLDAEAFLLGAAVGLVSEGILGKTLQDGISFLGVDWFGSLASIFDWGMIAVVSLHVVDAFRPRLEDESSSESSGLLELVALVFIPAAALVMYLFDAWVGRTRFQRMLGPTWLLADLLFAAAAWALVRRAAVRSESAEPEERDVWLWALAIFCGWLPGAQLFARAGGQWPSLLSAMYAAAWTAGFGAWMWRLWRERGHASWEPKHASRAILALAAWRLLGALIVYLVLGPVVDEPRSAAAFGFLVDLPTRLIFLTIFFSSCLAV